VPRHVGHSFIAKGLDVAWRAMDADVAAAYASATASSGKVNTWSPSS
jgi:hypothetical protein